MCYTVSMRKIISVLVSMVLVACLCSCATTKGESVEGPMDATIRSITKTTAPSTNPDAIEAFNQGAALLEEGNYAEAEFYLRQAVYYDEDFVDALDYLGIVLRRLGETDEAIEVLQKSIQRDPINIVPYNSLAIAYVDKGDYKNALKVCDDAIKNIPESADGYYQKGMIYMNQEKYKEAIPCLEEAYSIYRKNMDDQYYEAAYSLGFCYYAQKEWNKAVKYFEMSLKQFPDDETLKEFYESAKSQK